MFSQLVFPLQVPYTDYHPTCDKCFCHFIVFGFMNLRIAARATSLGDLHHGRLTAQAFIVAVKLWR
jgi:hypothetical protein